MADARLTSSERLAVVEAMPFPTTDREIDQLLRAVEHIITKRVAEATVSAIASEASWLETAHDAAEALPYGIRAYHPAYLKGFKAAAGWVRFHANAPHLLEDRENING